MPDPTDELITILVEIRPRNPPGPAIGPAAPSAGREAAPEAEDGHVEWGWRGEISRRHLTRF